jgi:hypothetical protein
MMEEISGRTDNKTVMMLVSVGGIILFSSSWY